MKKGQSKTKYAKERRRGLVRGRGALLSAALILTAAWPPNGYAGSSDEFRRVIQQCLDHDYHVSDTLSFRNKEIACRIEDGRDSCSESVRKRLDALVTTGLLSENRESRELSVYAIADSGKGHIRVAGAGHNSGGKFTIYAVDIGRIVVTSIDNFTLPGRDSEGAQSTTVRFKVGTQTLEWATAYIALMPPQPNGNAQLGQSGTGTAHLQLTNQGCVVASESIRWFPIDQPH